MPEWFSIQSTSVDPTISTLGMRLVLAWLGGWVVAFLARRKKSCDDSDTLTLTLVLMSILIAMATQIIGDNVARAFSLVGALSIVRFRTAVPATRDVAFVLAAVIVGMAIGAGQYWVCGIGLVTVALATQTCPAAQTNGANRRTTSKDKNDQAWRLSIVVGLHHVASWEQELERVTQSYQLTTAETTRRGGALEMVYRIVPLADTDIAALIAALNATPNVQSVSAKQIS
ncbi:hypothetical protein CA13_07640 [Planctomycetes bacterium CA13]|uniref:Uncharacterized protein n=1 Tax=Novipirellula herctigrandis TaxID=2527986 RepID=A0A5C5YWF5_9BACT|nr:hypothetical protein CA13_07640 [Planctomycetes bacterium CA13]